MRPLRDQLEREVASLHSFVEVVSRACVPPPQAVSYSESSTKFFDYIGHLAEHTKLHIAGFEAHADDDNEEFIESRTELWTLRSAWRDLHQFVKPSADADTLNQPIALVAALVNRFRELKGFEATEFTIFHTDSFDYAQLNPRATEEAVAQLARIIDANTFPPNLGLIGLPNSQGNAVFLNCLLAHEIGEYAYARRGLEATLAPVAEAALGKHMQTDFTAQSLTLRSRMRKTVLQWAKEIFCDLFAIRLVGPCYSFAYIELFDLTNLLNKSATLLIGDNADSQAQSYRAYPSHPSHPFRVKAQAELLKADGWWEVIMNVDSRECAVIGALLDLKFDTFIEAEETSEQRRDPFVRALIDILPQTRKQVGDITDGIDVRLHEYSLLYDEIAEYLSNGVVPSTLNTKDSAGTLHKVHPSPITLLNASYRFYLQGVEGLMARIKGQNPSSPHDRTAWMRRIEHWTMKALEDVALLSGSGS